MYDLQAECGDGGIHDYEHDPFLESLGIAVTPLRMVASVNPWGEILPQGHFYSGDTAGTDNPSPSQVLNAPGSSYYEFDASPPTSPSNSRPSPSQVLEAPAPVDSYFARTGEDDDAEDEADSQPSSLPNPAAGLPTPSTTCTLFPCLRSGCEKKPPFNSQKLLNNHERRSHKQRIAVCPVCGKRFVYQNDVRKHHNINSHTELPPLPAWVPKKQRIRFVNTVTH